MGQITKQQWLKSLIRLFLSHSEASGLAVQSWCGSSVKSQEARPSLAHSFLALAARTSSQYEDRQLQPQPHPSLGNRTRKKKGRASLLPLRIPGNTTQHFCL